MSKIGTCNFYNFSAAYSYYRDYEPNMSRAELKSYVLRKIEEGDCKIGAPPIRQGEMLELNREGRYVIVIDGH